MLVNPQIYKHGRSALHSASASPSTASAHVNRQRSGPRARRSRGHEAGCALEGFVSQVISRNNVGLSGPYVIRTTREITDALEAEGFDVEFVDEGGGMSERERDRPSSADGTDTFRMRVMARSRER